MMKNPAYFCFAPCKKFLNALKFSETFFEHQLFIFCIAFLISIIATLYRAVGFFFETNSQLPVVLSYMVMGAAMALFIYAMAGNN